MSRPDLAAAMRALGLRTEANRIWRYEDGVHEPRLRQFAALARVFGVSMEALLYGEDEAERLARERERAGDDTRVTGG